MQNTTLYIFFTCNPADVSTTHFKFVFKCIINSIFPSSPKLHLFVGFLKYYCTECRIDFTLSLSETFELPLLKKMKLQFPTLKLLTPQCKQDHILYHPAAVTNLKL